LDKRTDFSQDQCDKRRQLLVFISWTLSDPRAQSIVTRNLFLFKF